MDNVPIVALCGFLGSGKTTLLRRWRRDEALANAAFIVHDLSEQGIDASLLSPDDKTPQAGSLVGRVAALHGQHSNKQLSESLGTTLEEISALNPSIVLSESTGAARPWPLIKALTQDSRFFLRHFIVTVDALNLHRDFLDGKMLTADLDAHGDPALCRAVEVLAEQLAFANVIVLTKTDTVTKAVIENQVSYLQKLQPHATIALSARAGLLLPQLENTPPPNFLTLSNKAKQLGLIQQTSTAENVEAVVFRDQRPFHPQRLHEACMNHLGTGLYRTKGFLWLASRPDHTLLWQQSGSQISLELTGLWRAELAKNADGKLLPEEVEHLQNMLKNEHPIFGDRHNEITIIGIETDRNAFLSALKNALCTPQEIEAWQNGESFPDPWPKSLRHSQ
ncbi:CobW family GTP-binding protein [Rubritalea spongiae]|uniref:CobW family GTP-binding protein n=1 Tax=Rubritalea spongiae TaxID=430797 RepID=A0ABW5E161_9BACT